MVIWSLFDGSGLMGQRWAEAGHTVYCFNADEGNHGEYFVKVSHPNIHYVNVWIDDNFLHKIPAMDRPDIIFAFPDCTMLSGAGAKFERSPEAIAQAVRNAERVEELGVRFGVPWMVENPVGRMSTEWRKPDDYFHPYEYGGYLGYEDEPFHPRMPTHDAYTKKTCLWHGGGFRMPKRKPVPHIGKFWGWAYLGGKSPKTKQLRSLTPRGFARAVFEANCGVMA